MHITQLISVTSAGFLLAVLWMDLMFDVQVLRHRAGDLPESFLASIAAYYAHVTAPPVAMGRLITLNMLVLLATQVLDLIRTRGACSVTWASLALSALPIGLALVRIVPNAIRLGRRIDAVSRQSTLARAICRDHLFCFAAILIFIVVRIVSAP